VTHEQQPPIPKGLNHEQLAGEPIELTLNIRESLKYMIKNIYAYFLQAKEQGQTNQSNHILVTSVS
jgi:hypothetical protein